MVACGRGAPTSDHAGATAAAALVGALTEAEAIRAPWRCAALPAPASAEVTVGDRRWTPTPLGLTSAGGELRLAAVAEARGVAEPRLSAALAAAQIEVVVTVGGMGTSEAELTAALGAVVDPRWLTVAVPGEAEAFPAHRAAVAALAAGGAAIVDGAAVRVLDAGPVVIATLPGAGHRARLAAGDEGCAHELADATAVIAAATERAAERPVILVSPRAPQGGAGDRMAGGVHAGDPALTPAVATVALVIHAPLDGAPVVADLDRGPSVDSIAAGTLDPVVRYRADGVHLPASATAIVADGRELRWQPLVLPAR
jgi:molybdopterin biosynthesis enzyme MoaB